MEDVRGLDRLPSFLIKKHAGPISPVQCGTFQQVTCSRSLSGSIQVGLDGSERKNGPVFNSVLHIKALSESDA